MKVVIALCLMFVAAVYSAPTFESSLDQSWELFKRVHAKDYSVAQEQYRRGVWEANVAKIQTHNLEADLGVHTYTMKMNKYGDLTHQEFVKQMNGLKSAGRTVDGKIDRHTFIPLSNIEIPAAVDWRKQGYVTGVKDQGQCGSCWAFSATGSLEGQHFKKYSQLVSLSEQNLVDCSGKFGNMGCNGGLMDQAFQYIKANMGIDTEISYPYEARDNTCRFQPQNVGANDTGFTDIKSGSEADLQSAIATVGPVSVAIDASQSSFQFYSKGVYNEPHCSSTELDHGVLAVGYDKKGIHDYYIVKNSWGESWGNDGYIWMSRNKKNQCGIATMSSYPLV
ncbi:unnamed protein product [Didymodactylos carnosus]|uniref:Cathepsin L n=1 Tax=Didymodactylos carnosus TaxID=1234261 RepID=A0A814Z4C9_9BILA|nr:unnamed protein product [Didymodactylos carnosus]CAF1238905.1 unnamed protein product [Didymodactylos carnosus]CAF3819542.1 unnamed protein product [Didymodactylos carnosus]CAF4001079.1 unnamed protein product [Didymodactylos carnosus]